MYSKVNTAILSGVDSRIVKVETDISDGMPMISMVGFLSSEVKEAKDRVRTALKNLGINLPVKRITINISPASIKKTGTGFDLPVAVSVLAAIGVVPREGLSDMMFAGEVGLQGEIYPVNGILPMVLSAKEEGIKICVVPRDNYREALLVPGITVVGLQNLEELMEYLNEGIVPEIPVEKPTEKEKYGGYTDFSDINGMPLLRRACEIAVSGMHNIILVGPPGAGKSYISKALPTIMPELLESEQIELSKIYSVSGLFGDRNSLIGERPFRSPHHTISDIGLVGGGPGPKPGEISLAHKGILFLDEMLEFKRSALEILRQPLEDGKVSIVRASGNFIFPSDFMLVGAMNPCPCGYYPDINRCRCTSKQIKAYHSKLSRPIVDRVDICLEIPITKYMDIAVKSKNESSMEIRKRVERVHGIQIARFKDEKFIFNAKIPPKSIEKYCRLGKEQEDYLSGIFEEMSLTARSYHKILRVARTIADMEDSPEIKLSHLKEAVCYRMTEGEGQNV